ncbi:MAG: iron chaperone [Acidimicrobiia bacterium]
MTAKKSSAKSTSATSKKSGGFTAEERAAMKERAKEARGKGDGEGEVLAKIAGMKDPDRAMAKKLHAIMKENAPNLLPKTWYGMPAYAKDGKVVCFFTPAAKFKSRYATLGFNDDANLDEGAMWPTSYAITKLTATEEAKIIKLVKKAAS